MANQHVQILSPHYDDAALSLCDHIVHWKRKSITISIYNIFTDFETQILSIDAFRSIRKARCANTDEFKKKRNREDAQALAALKVNTRIDMNYIDGGFRESNGLPKYTYLSSLFNRNAFKQEKQLFEKILATMRKNISTGHMVALPLAIGDHIDHVLTRKAAEILVPESRRIYYVDFPYALNRSNWNSDHIKLFSKMKFSLRGFSEKKHRIINCYRSQIPSLFDIKPSYPEIVFYSKKIKL